MALTEAVNHTQMRPANAPRGEGKRGRGRRPGGPNSRGAARAARDNVSAPGAPVQTKEAEEITDPRIVEGAEENVCWICAEPVKYYSISECNHRTCHVCALRLRALYKKTDCTFCKDPQPSVIFTVSPDALFSKFTLESIAFKDAKLSIHFETQEMMEETLVLLRFNCPDPDCDYIGNGWGDLKLHVRATHGRLMCDLCIRFKKVFAHEHALYPPNILPVHLPSMHHRQQNKLVTKDQIEGGIHPMCEFCRECFFGDDELYSHLRERHEECFICKRNEIKDKYFQNYESLETHFNTVHYPCSQGSCLARKFVVFNTPLDLKAHMVEEHGGDMNSRDKKDARRIQAEFEFEQVGGRFRRGDRSHRERDQAQQQPPPPPPPPPLPSAPPRPPGGDRRRLGFGASLTVEGSASPSPSHDAPEHSRPSSPPHGDMDPALTERNALFIARVQSLASNPSTAIPAVKAAIRGYRTSETSSRDLILTIWNVLDQSLEHTASVVNAFVDLLDQEDKKTDLLGSWKGFVIEQRQQFPELVPTAVGSDYAAIATGRVLTAKHSTATRSSQRTSRQVWDRVAQAAGSSSSSIQSPVPRTADRFPSLQATYAGPSHMPAHRQGQRNTPWSSSSSTGFRTSSTTPATNQSITVVPDPRGSKPGSGTSTPQPPPPKLSNSLFPELPTSNVSRPKAAVSGNVSLKNILGNSAPPSATAWKAGSTNGENASTAANAEEGNSTTTTSSGKGKKGRGKQKQTLFTLGSFPT